MNNNILSITQNAADQIKKIISTSKEKCLGVKVDVDKSGCSGYAYKMDYAFENLDGFDVVHDKGVKVFIDANMEIMKAQDFKDHCRKPYGPINMIKFDELE